MPLRIIRSESIFRTIRELPGIGRRPRTRDDKRLGRNLPIDFMIVRQKPDQTFIFRILPAKNLNFRLLAYIFVETSSITFHGAKPNNYTIRTDEATLVVLLEKSAVN